MRCQCCNANLSNYESVLRHPETMEFLDICTRCLKDIPIQPLEPANMENDVGFDIVDDDLLPEEFNGYGDDYDEEE